MSRRFPPMRRPSPDPEFWLRGTTDQKPRSCVRLDCQTLSALCPIGPIRGFARPCVSADALRHTWGTRWPSEQPLGKPAKKRFPTLKEVGVGASAKPLPPPSVQGHWGVVGPGHQPATGTHVAMVQAERWGVSQPPGSAVTARAPGLCSLRTHVSCTLLSRWVARRFRENLPR